MEDNLFKIADNFGIYGRYEPVVPGLDVMVSTLDSFVPGAKKYILGFQKKVASKDFPLQGVGGGVHHQMGRHHIFSKRIRSIQQWIHDGPL